MPSRRSLLTVAGAATLSSCMGGDGVRPPPSPRPATRLAVRLLGAATANRPVELAVDTDGVWRNPFDPAQVDLRVTATGPGGRSLTVPAFWYQAYAPDGARPDGAPGWRARCTIPIPGGWSVRASLGGLASEPLDVPVGVAEPRDAPGFVRLDRSRTGFAYDDGTVFLPVGANIAWSRSPEPAAVLADYERWFGRLGAAGGTATRVWMAPWSFSVEWTDTPLGDYTARLRQACLLDRVFEIATRHGIRIMLTLLNHGQFSTTTNPDWAGNPYRKENGGPLADPADFVTNPVALGFFERRLRYVAALWASQPALWAWEWWNEVNLTPISDALLAPWIERMTPVLRAADPYRHLITTSYASGGGSDIWRLPVLDFACEHIYSGDDPATRLAERAVAARDRAAGKPVVLAEYGASGAADDPKIDPEGIHWHNGLWAAPFCGFAGPAMYWWWDEYLDPRDLWGGVRGIASFLAGELLSLYTPVTPQVSGDVVALALRRPDRVLAWVRAAAYERDAAEKAFSDAARDALSKGVPLSYEYRPPTVSGVSLTLTGLARGPWRARWLSTQDGAELSTVPVTVGPSGSVTVAVLAFTRDIALKLDRT